MRTGRLTEHQGGGRPPWVQMKTMAAREVVVRGRRGRRRWGCSDAAGVDSICRGAGIVEKRVILKLGHFSS
ncbi:hypothetical protein NHX12_007049 [Muraenolepis orangiensis]|uniref:Uncharacterized protein n=1 Tax=Muraenolepis orangiensis TaxID=630683 RepID=A0A9Q0DM67_9TELE|nr:hypothetical protein NHX12_007049 [Muraenolepis orangiensis]